MEYNPGYDPCNPNKSIFSVSGREFVKFSTVLMRIYFVRESRSFSPSGLVNPPLLPLSLETPFKIETREVMSSMSSSS